MTEVAMWNRCIGWVRVLKVSERSSTLPRPASVSNQVDSIRLGL
jgi:hypothetical protein